MKKILALLFIAASLISCDKDDSNLVDEDFANTERVVGFLRTTQNVPYFEDLGTIRREFPFDIMNGGSGTPYNEDLTITYEVDPSSTAVEGLEYNFVNSSKTVVVPAGTNFGMLPLDVITGNFNVTQKTTLVLNITAVDKEGFVISNQSRKVAINFIGCLSLVNGTYTVVVTRGDGVSVTRTNEQVTLQGINYFRTTTTGTFTVGQLSPPAPFAGYFFTDICDDISVDLQNLGGFYSNTVKGLTSDGTDGKVLSPTQFRVTYEVSFAAGNQTYTGVYTRI